MAVFWYSRRKICHGWIHRVDRFLSEIGKIKSRKKTPVQQSFGRTAKKNAGFAWLSALLPRLYPPVPVAAVCFSCRSVSSVAGFVCLPVPVARCRCPPACLDYTRQFQLQLPVRRSSAGFGCRPVPSVAGYRFWLRLHSSFSYSSDLAAPIGFARLLRLPVRRSSAGFGRRSVPSAVGCGYTPAPVACCGCLPASRLWDSVA